VPTCPQLWGGGMHHDAAASSYGRCASGRRHVAFAFGHNWVILAIWVPYPWNPDRGVAIPVLFRIYRSKKTSPKQHRRKRTILAFEMLQILRGGASCADLGGLRRVTWAPPLSFWTPRPSPQGRGQIMLSASRTTLDVQRHCRTL